MKRKIIPLLVLGIMLTILVTQVDAAIFPSVEGYVKNSDGVLLEDVKVTMIYKGIVQDINYTNSEGAYAVQINEPIFGSTKVSVLLRFQKAGYTTRTLGCLLGRDGVYKIVTLYEPIDTTPPAKVTGVVAEAPSDDTIVLTWNANTESDFSYYQIYREDLGWDSRLDWTWETTYTDNGLDPDTEYTYRITALDKSLNEGEMSADASVYTSFGYAILVGIGTYQHTSEFSETYGDVDVDMWSNLFSSIGYPHIVELKESQATEDNIWMAISIATCTIRHQDRLAIILSGHGGTDESDNQWFYTYESDAYSTGFLHDWELRNELQWLDASQLFLFMRSCYSGGFASEIESLSSPSLNVYVSTASLANGTSWNSEVEDCGGWTYHIVYYANEYANDNGNVFFNDEIIGAAEAAYIDEIEDNNGYHYGNNPYHTPFGEITL